MIDRNYSIDKLRIVGAFLVIIIHSPLDGILGACVETIARTSVPFFFMVSGYYVDRSNGDLILKRIRHLFSLLLGSCLLYFLWRFAWSFRVNETFKLIKSTVSLHTLFETIVLQQGSLLGHLWFLLALIFCYFSWLLLKKNGIKRTFLLAIMLMIAHYVVKIILVNCKFDNASYYTRNFLLTGFPMFLIGCSIDKKKRNMSHPSGYLSLLYIVAGLFLCAIERLFITKAELYLGSIFLAAGFLILAVEHPGRSNAISRFGKCYSEYVYIFHVLVLSCLNMFASLTGILNNSLFVNSRPFLVLLLSLLLAFLISNFRSKRKVLK